MRKFFPPAVNLAYQAARCQGDLQYAVETLRYIGNKVEGALEQQERADLADLANEAVKKLAGD